MYLYKHTYIIIYIYIPNTVEVLSFFRVGINCYMYILIDEKLN